MTQQIQRMTVQQVEKWISATDAPVIVELNQVGSMNIFYVTFAEPLAINHLNLISAMGFTILAGALGLARYMLIWKPSPDDETD